MGSSKPPRPPADRGQGRKKIDGGEGKSPRISLAVSQALKDKVLEKGAQWARDALTKSG